MMAAILVRTSTASAAAIAGIVSGATISTTATTTRSLASAYDVVLRQSIDTCIWPPLVMAVVAACQVVFHVVRCFSDQKIVHVEAGGQGGWHSTIAADLCCCKSHGSRR